MNAPVNKPVDLVVEEYKRTRNEVDALYEQWMKDPSDKNHSNLCFKMGEYSTVLRFTSQHAAAIKDKVLAAELETNRVFFGKRWTIVLHSGNNRQ